MKSSAAIERELDEHRRRLATHLQGLEGRTRDALSVRRRIVNRPGPSLAAALSAGLVLGAVARKRFQTPSRTSAAANAKDSRSAVLRLAKETLMTAVLHLASAELKRRRDRRAAARGGRMDASRRPAIRGMDQIGP